MIIFTKDEKKNERGETKKIVALFDTWTGIEYQLVVVKKAEEKVKLVISSVHSAEVYTFYGEVAKQAWTQLGSWEELSPGAVQAALSCFE